MIYKEYTGVIVNVKDTLRIGRVQVRIPFLHGGDYTFNEPTEKNSIANADLPWATVDAEVGKNPNVKQDKKYQAGEIVIIKFYDQEYEDIPGQQPHVLRPASSIERKVAVNPTPVRPPVVSPVNTPDIGPNTVSVSQTYELFSPGNCAGQNPSEVYGPPNPSINLADGKCGQQSKIKGSFAENISDFLNIVQNTNGKVGTKLVSKYTGELFSAFNYVKKYTASILGIFRDGLKWIKAVITKYVRIAIDELVKVLIVPFKGILDVIQPVLEDALNKIGCTFGDIERQIADLIESLLLALVNSGLNAVFGCLDTLVDGILNQILSSVSTLIDSIFSSIQAIAGLVGNIGDLAGQALSAVLDILGISCGGTGDCAGEKSFSVKLFSNDEYGIPDEVKKGLQTGLNAIDNVSQGILTGAGGVEELNKANEKLNKSSELGTANFNDRSTFSGQTINNRALNNAINVAQSLIPTGNLSSFCNTLGANQPTFAVILGSPVTKNNSVYSVFNKSPKTFTGGSVPIRITRDLANAKGVILVVAYKGANDTVRISSQGKKGDVDVDGTFLNEDFVADSRLTFKTGDVFFFRKLVFEAGQTEKEIQIPTNIQEPLDVTIDSVKFSVGIFRAADDIKLNETYPGDNLPSTSTALNTTSTKIYFELPDPVIPSGAPTPKAPYVTISGDTGPGDTQVCIPSILITSQPPATITAKDGDSVSIGTVARSTVAGYTLTYQWQTSRNPFSGWTNVVDGSVTSTYVTKKQQYGIIASGYTVVGSSYSLYGYKDVSTTVSSVTTYGGSNTQILNISSVSYYTSGRYYRCVVSSPTLSSVTTSNSLLNVTSSNSFTVPTIVTTNNVIKNPDNTEAGTVPPTASGVVCVPYTPPTVVAPTEPTPTISGVTIPGTPSETSDSSKPITGVTPPDSNLPGIAPVVIGPDGGINSITIPDNLPQFSSTPIISITGPGAGATAKGILDQNGKLSKILVTSRGFGYTPSTNNLCGILDSIELISVGAFFTSSPTVYINGDSSIAVADIDDAGMVTQIRIVSPQNKVFDKIPKVEIYGGNGIGASGKAVIRYVDCANVANEYLNVLNRYNTTQRGSVKVVDCP